MTLSLDARLSIPQDVIYREIDGEAVILNLQTGVYFGLDPVGTRIWQLLEESLSLATVCQAIEQEFNAARPTIERDVIDLVSRLLDKGLVEVTR